MRTIARLVPRIRPPSPVASVPPAFVLLRTLALVPMLLFSPTLVRDAPGRTAVGDLPRHAADEDDAARLRSLAPLLELPGGEPLAEAVLPDAEDPHARARFFRLEDGTRILETVVVSKASRHVLRRFHKAEENRRELLDLDPGETARFRGGLDEARAHAAKDEDGYEAFGWDVVSGRGREIALFYVVRRMPAGEGESPSAAEEGPKGPFSTGLRKEGPVAAVDLTPRYVDALLEDVGLNVLGLPIEGIERESVDAR